MHGHRWITRRTALSSNSFTKIIQIPSNTNVFLWRKSSLDFCQLSSIKIRNQQIWSDYIAENPWLTNHSATMDCWRARHQIPTRKIESIVKTGPIHESLDQFDHFGSKAPNLRLEIRKMHIVVGLDRFGYGLSVNYELNAEQARAHKRQN